MVRVGSGKAKKERRTIRRENQQRNPEKKYIGREKENERGKKCRVIYRVKNIM